MNTNLVVPGELKKIQDIPRNQNYPLDKQQKREKLLGFFFIFNQTRKLPCKKTTGMWQFIFFSLFHFCCYYCYHRTGILFSCSIAKRERLFFFPFSASCLHHSLNGQLEFHSINVVGHTPFLLRLVAASRFDVGNI